jgi:hypothetical protein
VTAGGDEWGGYVEEPEEQPDDVRPGTKPPDDTTIVRPGVPPDDTTAPSPGPPPDDTTVVRRAAAPDDPINPRVLAASRAA